MSNSVPISEWSDLMQQVVTIQPFVGRDTYGVASYASPYSCAARVNYKTHFVRYGTSEQALARGVAWLALETPVSVNDKIYLPDGSTPLILDSVLETDEAAPLYVRLDFA